MINKTKHRPHAGAGLQPVPTIKEKKHRSQTCASGGEISVTVSHICIFKLYIRYDGLVFQKQHLI